MLGFHRRFGGSDVCARLGVAVLVAVATLALAGTAFAQSQASREILGTNQAEVPMLDWGACPSSTPEEEEFLRPYRCTTAEVPVSYRDVSGQSLELALGLLPARVRTHPSPLLGCSS
jgi:hypothetical protein